METVRRRKGIVGKGGFNSATACEPWKHGVVIRHNRHDLGFNSATACEPWKPPGSWQPFTRVTTLQFGHGV